MGGNLEDKWDIITTTLQDVFTANRINSLDPLTIEASEARLSSSPADRLKDLIATLNQHRENVDQCDRLLGTVLENVDLLINAKRASASPKLPGNRSSTGPSYKRAKSNVKKGKSYFTSQYNTSTPIVIGSEVAYKLRTPTSSDWIQCEVTKVIDLTHFKIRDPEPDDNNFCQVYDVDWKEIILIPSAQDVSSLKNYPNRSRVLARYPETTTFYPAEVISSKRDGRCRLKFEGEEEEGKETEVQRRFVLPFPK
ncbi:Sgf29p ASCRUDRAFT_30799 [Ascoidea rubescens DSM 1968]|uniref:SGF29 C-terminal domain-containing protein n=1 Tax=Ascoidea rubescens DSM 1968 TaxID=1344418 RepID=A0A1D2VQY2_9ASCO|nr:hypothetical protein ASCRUDRAFT_30799 [Ascoidea rubescens DSM 1968]ODV63975.1 hypothetical protein ASCRUDRAFT_30799 [Ascoidea rubescens DSM 1968]